MFSAKWNTWCCARTFDREKYIHTSLHTQTQTHIRSYTNSMILKTSPLFSNCSQGKTENEYSEGREINKKKAVAKEVRITKQGYKVK